MYENSPLTQEHVCCEENIFILLLNEKRIEITKNYR